MVKNEIKCISFDIDGTLYAYDQDVWGISESTFQSLKELKENGYLLVMNTGRSRNDLPMQIEKLFDYFVLCNGSLVLDAEKNKLMEFSLSFQDVEIIIDFCSKNNRNLMVKTEQASYYYNYANAIPDYMKRENEVNFILGNYKEHLQENVLSLALDLNENELLELKELLPNSSFAHGGFDFYEIFSAKTNKFEGLKVVLDIENIDKIECMAFGDSMNDLEILQQVGKGVAMADGHTNLLRHIKEICLPAHSDGITKYLKNCNMI